MSCGCPRPEEVGIVIEFIEKIGDIETSHRVECEYDRENIIASSASESEKRTKIAKAKVEHKVRCRIDKITEFKRFCEEHPFLKDAVCRYL